MKQTNIAFRVSGVTLLALLLVVLLGATILAACGGSEVAANQAATGTALAGVLNGEDTADTPNDGAAADTPVPEAAPTDENVAAVAATATARAAEVEAASAAEATVQAEASAATATAVAPILADLQTYGIDPANGQLAWIHPPLTLDIEGYRQYDYANQFLATVAQDFVLSADITWNTRFGLTGCGFVVRSDGNEEALNQYFIIATRGAQGHVVFGTQINGELELEEVTDIYANGIDPLFEWQNDKTNRIAVVARGNDFTLYSNGTQLGTLTGTAGFEKGFVAFVALNESGTTTCTFNNAWLWLLNG